MGVQGGAIIPIRMERFKHPGGEGRIAGRHGGVAEWFRQGPAKPRTAVRFRPPPPIGAPRHRSLRHPVGSIPLTGDPLCARVR